MTLLSFINYMQIRNY